jgi:hypothetical protein
VIPELALGILNESLKLANSVWDAMTPEQRQYWIQKGIDNDKAFVAFVTDFLKSLGIEA